MKNIGQMLKQAQELQNKMAEMQERLAESEIRRNSVPASSRSTFLPDTSMK